VQEIVDWLDKLALGQYAQRFAENDISFFILPDLTDQDLEKIGVASLGHRRLLLRAIAEGDYPSLDRDSKSSYAGTDRPTRKAPGWG
jgi:hypothetical protein